MRNPAPSTTLEFAKTLNKRIIRIVAAFLKYLTIAILLLACIGSFISARNHARRQSSERGLAGLSRQQLRHAGHSGGLHSSPRQPPQLHSKSRPTPQQKLGGFGQHPRQYTMYKRNGDPVTAQERADAQKMMDEIVDKMMSDPETQSFTSTPYHEETAQQQRTSPGDRKANQGRNKKKSKGTGKGNIERNTQLAMDNIIANLELQISKEDADVVRGVRDKLVNTVGSEKDGEATKEDYHGKVRKKKSSHKVGVLNRKSNTLTKSNGSPVKREVMQSHE